MNVITREELEKELENMDITKETVIEIVFDVFSLLAERKDIWKKYIKLADTMKTARKDYKTLLDKYNDLAVESNRMYDEYNNLVDQYNCLLNEYDTLKSKQTPPKPIETIYKGYKFRSRLEARWAVFFDALGVQWEYEKEGYELGELGWYLPDFYLPDSKLFIEIKGNANDEKGIAKARYLNENPPENVIGCLILSQIEYTLNVNEPHLTSVAKLCEFITPDKKDIDITNCVNIARQERFEKVN